MGQSMRRAALTLVLVVACGPEKPDDGQSSATSGSDATVTTTGTNSQGPTEATSTGLTGATTTASGTEGLGMTTSGTGTGAPTTSDTGLDTTTDGLRWGECAEPFMDWFEEHVDCIVDWPTATMVHGEGQAAGIMPVTRVFFGVFYWVCSDGLTLQQIALHDPLQPTARLFGGLECGPEQWIGEHAREGMIPNTNITLDVKMTIDGFTGDWMSADPVDPPRILGTFSGDLVGPFEAIHCAALDEAIWNCS